MCTFRRAFAVATAIFSVVTVISIVILAVVMVRDRKESTAAAPITSVDQHKQLWHCGMHPQVIQDHPGNCPICGMPLTPINAGGPTGEVTIDPAIVQNMGVQTARVTRGRVNKSVRGLGVFRIAEPGMHDIALRVGGWVDKLFADQEGMHVHQGDPLLALYSPQLQVAEQELIAATKSRRSLDAGANATLVREADGLVNSARRKLALWGIDQREIDAIAKADQPPKDVTIYSPATGHIEDKMIVQGSAVQPGMKLMRVVDHTTMWLDVQVFERQLPFIAVGQPIDVSLESAPGKTFTGKVDFLYPHLDHMTRTVTVRATFENPDFELRPGMYARASIRTEPAKDAILIPQEALIDTGTRQLVFVALGDGHFAPRTVRAGIRGDDGKVQILDGLEEGQTVVTSGQFLMDVESRMSEALAKLNPAADRAKAPSTRPAELSLLYCAMNKVSWVQPTGAVTNPYVGEDMRDCGEVRASMPNPPAGSPLSGVVAAYLNVERSLISGTVDGKANSELKSAAARLHGEAFVPLQAAAEALYNVRDLEAARHQFKAVSDALIALLKEKP